MWNPEHERGDQPSKHILSCYKCKSGIGHDQFRVDKKKNEEYAYKEILHPPLVKGRIIGADAIFSC